MNFRIFVVENGFLLNITYSRNKVKSYIYTKKERMTMFAKINQVLGEEPEDSVGMERGRDNTHHD